MLLDHESLDGLKKTQRVKISCDRCKTIVEKIVYNLIKQREARNEDLCKSCATTEYNKTRPVEVRKKAGDGYRLKYTGKKLEDIVGDAKASRMKKQFSESKRGENNINYGGKYSKGFADRPLCGTFESLYGDEKAAKLKSDMSKRRTGSGNPMYGKPAPIKSGNGISGRYHGIYFRSLLELSYMLHLDSLKVSFISCESTKTKFQYSIDGQTFSYFPDFYLPETDEFVEVKPSQMLRNKVIVAKAKSVQDAGCKFTFVTQKDMIKIKKDQLIALINAGQVIIDDGKKSRL